VLSTPGTATPSSTTLSLHDALPICRFTKSTHRKSRRGSIQSINSMQSFVRGMQRVSTASGSATLFANFGEPLEAFPEDSDARSRSEEHTSELQSPCNLVCRLLLEKK